jgi:hypothetical protein
VAKKFISNTFPLKSALSIIVPSDTDGREKSGINSFPSPLARMEPLLTIKKNKLTNNVAKYLFFTLAAFFYSYG